jgi:hypothetical protein
MASDWIWEGTKLRRTVIQGGETVDELKTNIRILDVAV